MLTGTLLVEFFMRLFLDNKRTSEISKASLQPGRVQRVFDYSRECTGVLKSS
jgi:hypothetical protein